MLPIGGDNQTYAHAQIKRNTGKRSPETRAAWQTVQDATLLIAALVGLITVGWGVWAVDPALTGASVGTFTVR